MTTQPGQKLIAETEPPPRRARTSTHNVVRILRREIADEHYALLRAARY
jgi:hypothetical protein